MNKAFDDREGWIWMNGSFIPWRSATIPIVTQGLHYASTVFEGERAYNGKIFKSLEHTKRLFRSAEIIGMKIPFSESEIEQAKKDLISKMDFKNCYVRPVVWRGSQQMGLSTSNADINVAIAAWDDWHSYFNEQDRLDGLTLITSPWRKPAPDTAPYEAKASGPYIICTMSKQFAENKGYKDALMLDYRGYVAEGTGANIFFIKGDNIHTPIPDCFLNGITRQAVIEIVKNKGFKLIEKHILPEEIDKYDEAFLTGTAAEITPIKSIDKIEYNVGNNTTGYELIKDFTNLVNSSL